MIIYVDQTVEKSGDGTKEYPFQTIGEAAKAAEPGDEVLVAPGVYRESVDPERGGTQEKPIVYRSSVRHGAHITGAETAKNWKRMEGDVWELHIANGIFTDRNPFTTLVEGDWYIPFADNHTGDVFLNEKSMYEVQSLDDVRKPKRNELSWDEDFSCFTWYCEQDAARDETILYANFGGKNPNEENVEISCRKNCFYPSEEGKSYITLSGFRISKAATQWAPPTAYQEGMVGPHWSKGWVIEDCEIYESKCSGISLGKYLQQDNDNKWLKWKYKDGTQTQRECVCQAVCEGWDMEYIGSHTVRNCIIHDCGQTGIVGHLGGICAVIEHNHIYQINNKQNLGGAEVGGIKMHAAIDAVIRGNHIHHCSRGIWLDWQAQGTRVTENLFHDNCLPGDLAAGQKKLQCMGEDLFIEVSHGPTLVDNNIMLSERSAKVATQGVAFVHNLICGAFTCVGRGTDNGAPDLPSPRYTPYHVKHGTQIAGFMTILHGDMRFYNNIFIQQPLRRQLETLAAMISPDDMWDSGNLTVGTFVYDGYPTFEEWDSQFAGYHGMGGENGNLYYDHLPVWSAGNVYLNGAKAWEKEENAYCAEDVPVTIRFEAEGNGWSVLTNLKEILGEKRCEMISTETLGRAFEPEQKFENPDGTPIIFDKGVAGADCKDVIPGPFGTGKLRWYVESC